MKTLLVVIFFFFGIGAIHAQETPRADVRQANQNTRIQEGRTSGVLTRRESKMLRKEQRHIHRAERRTKADGDVTRAERRRLERKQDRANRHIYRAKNNEIQPK